MSRDNNDIVNGMKYIGLGVLAGFIFSPTLAAVIFFIIAVYFGMSGLMMLASDGGARPSGAVGRPSGAASVPSAASAPTPDSPTIADVIAAINTKRDLKCPSCGATIKPTDVKCRFCGSYLVPPADLPRPAKFGEVELDATLRVNHPQRGQLNLRVLQRVYYGELWQARSGANVPWTLTGNYFVGLGLEGGLYLLTWQGRNYLLETRAPLTDMDINRDFAPHARKFAASNQTARVDFGYQGATWRIEDIGRFRLELADGEGLEITPGTVGRFIHATRENQVLVVEDYQAGGSGRDTLWSGYRLEDKDIQL
jgi:hypothetical protein